LLTSGAKLGEGALTRPSGEPLVEVEPSRAQRLAALGVEQRRLLKLTGRFRRHGATVAGREETPQKTHDGIV
jgi:hypothetical protein